MPNRKFFKFSCKDYHYGNQSVTSCYLHFTISGSHFLRAFHESDSSDDGFDCNNWSVPDFVHLCFHSRKWAHGIECLRNHRCIHLPSGVYTFISEGARFTSSALGRSFGSVGSDCLWNSCGICHLQAELC